MIITTESAIIVMLFSFYIVVVGGTVHWGPIANWLRAGGVRKRRECTRSSGALGRSLQASSGVRIHPPPAHCDTPCACAPHGLPGRSVHAARIEQNSIFAIAPLCARP